MLDNLFRVRQMIKATKTTVKKQLCNHMLLILHLNTNKITGMMENNSMIEKFVYPYYV